MKVQDILTDESKWTKQFFARKANGHYASPDNDDAVCWCILGAIQKAYPDLTEQNKILTKLYAKFPGKSVTVWNDFNASFPEVRALIEELDI